jgi:hypothetical protein
VDEIEKKSDVLEEPWEEPDQDEAEDEAGEEPDQDEAGEEPGEDEPGEAEVVVLTEGNKLNINNKMYEIYYGIYLIKLVLIIIISFYLFGEKPSYELLYFVWCLYHIFNISTLSVIIWVEYNRPEKLASYKMFQNQMVKLQHIDHFAGTLFILHILRMKI